MNPLLLLKLVPSTAWYGAALMVAIGAVYAGHLVDVSKHEKVARVAGRAEVQAKWDAQKLVDQAAALQLEEKYRHDEAQWQANAESTVTKYEEQIQLIKQAAAGRTAGDDRVRNELAAIAAHASDAASAPGAACRTENERIASGAGLLSEAYDLANEGEDLARRLDAKVTALQEFVAGSCSSAPVAGLATR